MSFSSQILSSFELLIFKMLTQEAEIKGSTEHLLEVSSPFYQLPFPWIQMKGKSCWSPNQLDSNLALQSALG